MNLFVRWVGGTMLLVLLVALAAGCGSSGGSSTSGSGEGSSAKEEDGGEAVVASDSGVSEAKKIVAEKSDLTNLEWPEPPNEPFDPGHKRAAVITCGVAGEGCRREGMEAMTAIKAAGWTVTELGDGKFSPSVQAGLIERAVQEKVGGIVLTEIPVETVKTAVESAEGAGVPITCLDCGAKVSGLPIPAADDVKQTPGEIDGDYITATSNGEASVMVVTLPELTASVEQSEGLGKVLKEKCPKCSFEEVKMTAAELTEPGPPAITGWLAAHEGQAEWIVANDAVLVPILKTFAERGDESLSHEIKMVGLDSEPIVLEAMLNGKLVKVNTFTPYAYTAWAAADLMLRESAGAKLWDARSMPYGLITKEQAPEVLDAEKTTEEYYSPPSFDFKKKFEKLWGR